MSNSRRSRDSSTLTNGTDAVEIAREMLIRPALNPQLAAA